MMLQPHDLLPLQRYRPLRPHVRRAMVAYRKNLAVDLGPHMRVQFEDLRTVWYQVQEVLHSDGVDDAAAVWAALETYAHLMPEPGQCKATVFLTGAAPGLMLLDQAIHHIAVRPHPAEGWLPAHADEDLDDGHRERPSGVHFLRFALPSASAAPACAGPRAIQLGCQHPGYAHQAALLAPWAFSDSLHTAARPQTLPS